MRFWDNNHPTLKNPDLLHPLFFGEHARDGEALNILRLVTEHVSSKQFQLCEFQSWPFLAQIALSRLRQAC